MVQAPDTNAKEPTEVVRKRDRKRENWTLVVFFLAAAIVLCALVLAMIFFFERISMAHGSGAGQIEPSDRR